MPMDLLSDYLDFAKDLALQAGDVMLEHFKVGVAWQAKDDGSAVTIADTAINTLVINAVAQKFPSHSVRGEEESNHVPGDEYVWVCDPIDGTLPFTLGIPISMFSIALVKDGQPIVAVTYDPFLRRLYHATSNSGAFMNEQPIRVNQAGLEKSTKFTVTTSMQMVDSIKLTTALREQFHSRLFIFNSAVYCAMLVATGQFGFYICGATGAHDIAACKLIVEKAGGRVTDLYGNEQRYDQPVRGAIISNGQVHDQLIELVKPFLQKAE